MWYCERRINNQSINAHDYKIYNTIGDSGFAAAHVRQRHDTLMANKYGYISIW